MPSSPKKNALCAHCVRKGRSDRGTTFVHRRPLRLRSLCGPVTGTSRERLREASVRPGPPLPARSFTARLRSHLPPVLPGRLPADGRSSLQGHTGVLLFFPACHYSSLSYRVWGGLSRPSAAHNSYLVGRRIPPFLRPPPAPAHIPRENCGPHPWDSGPPRPPGSSALPCGRW